MNMMPNLSDKPASLLWIDYSH